MNRKKKQKRNNNNENQKYNNEDDDDIGYKMGATELEWFESKTAYL